MKNAILWIFLLCFPLAASAQNEGVERLDPNSPSRVFQIIPSPVEMIVWGKALDIETEITVSLNILTYQYNKNNQQEGAIYLGRTLAIILLASERMDDRTLGRFLIKVKEALNALEVKQEYIDEYEGLRLRFENRTISRDDLVNRLDVAYAQLVSTATEADSKNLVYRIIQGTAWVQGQNLLATSIKKQNKYEYAKLLLDRPSVTNFILKALEEAKKEKQPASEIDPLIESMNIYLEVTSLSKLGSEEVSTIITETDKFLKKYK
ncbi:hypothetical protein WDW89_18530 [Deltaproteobacteria bacterium TL4]